MAGEPLAPVARRQLQVDAPAAVVEAAGLVGQDLGLEPGAAARGDFPAQRRVVGLDARALGLGTVDLDAQHQRGERHVEAEQQAVAGLGRVAEGAPVVVDRLRDAGRDADVALAVVALEDVGHRARRRDRRGRGGREHDRVLGAGPRRRDLGGVRGDRHRLECGAGEHEAQLRLRGARRSQVDVEQLE